MMSIYQPIIQTIHIYGLSETLSENDIINWFVESKIAIILQVNFMNFKRDARLQIGYFLYSEYANQFMCDIEIQSSLGKHIVYNIPNYHNQLVPIKMVLSK